MFWAAWRAAAKPVCSGTVPINRVTCCNCLSRNFCRGQPSTHAIGCQNPPSPRRVAVAAVEGESILFGNSRSNDRANISQYVAGVWMKLNPPMPESKPYKPINPFLQRTALQPSSEAVHPGCRLSLTAHAIFPQWQTIPKLQPERLECSPPGITTDQDQVLGGGAHGGVACSSVIKKRKMKMNRHKYKKRRKKLRFLRRRLGK